MKPTIFCLLSSICLLLNAQNKQDYVWVGGYQINVNGGANGYKLDFNKPFEVLYLNPPLGFLGNNTSICDKNGNLLFYTNGRAIVNSLHQIMPNGDSINAGKWADVFWKNPFDGYPGAQDVMILPDPKDEGGYYLFHKPNIYYPMIDDSIAMMYSKIDLNLESGIGDVITKNEVYYLPQNVLRYYFTAIQHENKKDWWILQPIEKDSIFLTFLLDSNGIKRMQDQNSHVYFTREKSSASGMAKFSPDGTKYALYNEYDKLLVYSFNRLTGSIIYKNKIITHDTSGQAIFCSVEWSPNSRFIYTATETKIHQVDTWASDLQESVIEVATYDGMQDPFSSIFNFMAQGPDCRIYITPKSGSNSLSVINKPNEKGTACNFVQNGIKLPYPNGGSLPNFPRFRVDDVDKCDPKITSVFGNAVYYRRELEVYPNPSNGLFMIKLPEAVSKANLIVTNVNGQIIHQKEIHSSKIEELDISSQPCGRYNIEVYPLDQSERVYFGVQVVKI